ncbi:MAG TPA: DUF5667 domain-containing protein [Candidatus Paceibacterota bacterium]|nr:DUF5667 domain-containing protein [Candidatus Paceibacterota bacterium]
MTNFQTQFHTNGTGIRMSDAERSRVHAALTARMHAAPVPSPFFTRYSFTLRAVGAFVLVLIIGSGGTAFAAEGSLPGDLLYPVKVGIVEPVQGAFQISDTAKANWNAHIATTRLVEAQALAAKGTLTPAVSAELAANFNTHASAVTAAAKSISASDPAAASDISADFSGAVAAHGAAILATGKTTTGASSAKTSGSLVLAIASDEDTSASDEAAPAAAQPMMAMMKSTTPPASGDDAQATRLSEEAHAALAGATSTLPTLGLSKAEFSQAKARAAVIQNRILRADAELSIGSSSEAVTDYNRAIRELTALMQTTTTSSRAPTTGVPSTSGSVHPTTLINIHP